MKKIVIGDYGTLMGTKDKPSKLTWLKEQRVDDIKGVQIISLTDDLYSESLLGYKDKLLDLYGKFPELERVSVAMLCWPLLKRNGAVAASNPVTQDFYIYFLWICRSLQELHDEIGVEVDISYHPMLTVPAEMVGLLPNRLNHQRFLWECEMRRREEMIELMKINNINDVGINIENEPTTSDDVASLFHTGNRIFTESIYKLPDGWGITADLQHLMMALGVFNTGGDRLKLTFPPMPETWAFDSGYWSLEKQFAELLKVGNITFHVSQLADIWRHVTPSLNFSDPIMDWKKIVQLMKELDRQRKGDVWYAIEQDGGHVFPAGYEQDLKAISEFQELIK